MQVLTCLFLPLLLPQKVYSKVDIFTVIQAIGFFSRDHLPYGVLALVILTLSNILPLLLLTFYPMRCFQKCLNCCKLSHNIIALHTFVDSFAGCYKDGTEPETRDCCYFAGL